MPAGSFLRVLLPHHGEEELLVLTDRFTVKLGAGFTCESDTSGCERVPGKGFMFVQYLSLHYNNLTIMTNSNVKMTSYTASYIFCSYYAGYNVLMY